MSPAASSCLQTDAAACMANHRRAARYLRAVGFNRLTRIAGTAHCAAHLGGECRGVECFRTALGREQLSRCDVLLERRAAWRSMRASGSYVPTSKFARCRTYDGACTCAPRTGVSGGGRMGATGRNRCSLVWTPQFRIRLCKGAFQDGLASVVSPFGMHSWRIAGLRLARLLLLLPPRQRAVLRIRLTWRETR